ncbi:oxidase [Xanthovirga aplysinae]|uniref:oxidase n=1 Tax=Xanthovirga aplysinae TaxID=2529853 RepID=UPI0012BD16C7|nr:oxidase [Xanthovirga aplysinae]MTI33157.1 oxidase [Xanthovirga aplysinae]
MDDKIKDILLEPNYDLKIENRDFAFGPSDQQHIELLMVANKGNFLEYPTAGMGIDRYKNGNISKTQFLREARLELEKDGYTVNEFSYDNGVIDLDVER